MRPHGYPPDALHRCDLRGREPDARGRATPALTQTLNRLEQEIGAKLFTRSRRGAALTEAGLAVVDDLRAALAHGDAAAERARAMGAGRLAIGFVTHAVYEVLPRALRKLHAEHPQLDVLLREMSNAEQVDALEGGRIDIALLHPPVSVSARVHELPVGAEPMLAALPADYELAADGCVSLAEIAQHGLVWFPEQDIPTLRTQMLSALRSAGHDPRVVQDASCELSGTAMRLAASIGKRRKHGKLARVAFR